MQRAATDKQAKAFVLLELLYAMDYPDKVAVVQAEVQHMLVGANNFAVPEFRRFVELEYKPVDFEQHTLDVMESRPVGVIHKLPEKQRKLSRRQRSAGTMLHDRKVFIIHF